MRLQKTPCWDLQLVQQGAFGRGSQIARFAPDKKKADDETADSGDVEQAIQHLENCLALYKDVPNVSFKITLRPTKQANQGSVLGPFDFSITGGAPQGTNGLAGIMQPSGLGALEQMAGLMGIVNQLNQGPEQKLAQLAGKEEALAAAKEAFQLEKIKLAMDQKDIEHQREKLKEDRKKFEEEIKEAKDKYEKRKDQVGDLADVAIGRVIEKFLDGEEKTTLAGTKTETREEQPSEEQKLVESIAENIFDNVKDKEQIKQIGIVVQYQINNPELSEKFTEIAKAEE